MTTLGKLYFYDDLEILDIDNNVGVYNGHSDRPYWYINIRANPDKWIRWNGECFIDDVVPPASVKAKLLLII